MQKKYLVTYASHYGSTAEIAARIGGILTTHALEVDVKSIAEVATLETYVGTVIGSPIYSGEWSQDMVTFINLYKEQLNRIPVAIFTAALRLRDSSEEMREAVLGTLYSYRMTLKPIAIGLFAGALDYGKLSPIVRLQLKSKQLPEGDFRDWAQIENWARSLPELFTARSHKTGTVGGSHDW